MFRREKKGESCPGRRLDDRGQQLARVDALEEPGPWTGEKEIDQLAIDQE